MGALFIAGNGFDIAHGISSSYGDFRRFLIKRFPEALEYRDEIIFVEDCENIDVQEFAAEILLSTMDKVSGINWSNFEEALAHIDFSDKLPKSNHSISPDTVWHFTAFEAKDKEALRIKKIKLRNYGFKGRFDIYEG